jgi:hypothetical protein
METLKKFGPYLAVELLLPGGTLIAILLYLFRGQSNISGAAAAAMSVARKILL